MAAIWSISRAIQLARHLRPRLPRRAHLSEEQLVNFRQEVDGKGLSSYPHPWLMPDFWQFPTVSMGLGPLMAIYQARFLRYLHGRGLRRHTQRKVWAFCGDGEMDEPESLGAISLAGREKLDNLIFVINCNLQRLDGPVRGNGKIIQELGGAISAAPAGTSSKCLWGTGWDALLAKDTTGAAPADGRMRRRRISGFQVEERRLHPRRNSSAAIPKRRPWSPTGPTRKSGR